MESFGEQNPRSWRDRLRNIGEIIVRGLASASVHSVYLDPTHFRGTQGQEPFDQPVTKPSIGDQAEAYLRGLDGEQ